MELPLQYALDPTTLSERSRRLRPSLGPRPVALHPFASKRNRCVALEEWIRFARALVRLDYGPVWIGSAAELREVRRSAGIDGWSYMDDIGDGTLADMAAVLSLSRLFVGHDSGPLHVAAALGVPVVGVFTPGEPRRTFPQGVGNWRMLVRNSPRGVGADELLAVVEELSVR